MSQSRELAAIMFTDIVGYTALMGEDEIKAFEILRKNRLLQKPIIEKYGGTLIKELGDGILASFHTVTDSVLCAGEIQNTCNEKNEFQLRIGIHQGEVIFEDHDVFGDSVNIASRLQAMAPIGGIWISESVHKNISNKKGIHSSFVRQETFKNVKEPVQVYEVSIDHSEAEQYRQVYLNKPRTNQPVETETPARQQILTPKQTHAKKSRFKWIISALVVIAIVLVGFSAFNRWRNIQRARNELIPQIQKLKEANFFTSTTFLLAKEAEKYIPNDSVLLKLWPEISKPFAFQTDPAGAKVYWREYDDEKEEWKPLGTTPIPNTRIPLGYIVIKIEKNGFEPILCPPTGARSQLVLKLDSLGKLPQKMVRVPGAVSPMLIPGLEQYAGNYVGEFLGDKYEVTNKDFKVFLDAGGYQDKQFWDYPIFSNGSEITWENAMKLFRDKTGKPGPAGWEVGTYPDGKEDHPVTGISWYEAMAFAKFSGKSLPNVFQWSKVANTVNAWRIIPKSNFMGSGTFPVGTMRGIGNWGVYDIAGNAREWCSNESNEKGWHYILGGGWNDPSYAFTDAHAEPAMDRSLSNGFRCVRLIPGDTTFDRLAGRIEFVFRDYREEKVVNDETFKVYQNQFAYDRSPLNPEVVTAGDTNLYKLEKITINAAYSKERFDIFLFLPKTSPPPYQTVVYFPGSGAIHARKFEAKNELLYFDFVLKSGRAICFPIIKGTFEREDELHSDLPSETVFHKEHVISWAQDINRSIDYLETRKDIQQAGFGYYGFSWGSQMGPVMCVTEPRIKAAVFHVGGLVMQKSLPEVDPFHFLPRVKIPVLMLNGKNDTFYPTETSQKPMYELLGTDTAHKKMIVYPGGHLVPRSELIKESLNWFDKYLGPVK